MITTLVEARNQAELWSSDAVLQRYHRQRYKDNLLMQGGMDLFYFTFSNKLPPLRFARNLALIAAENAGALKRKVLRYALGL